MIHTLVVTPIKEIVTLNTAVSVARLMWWAGIKEKRRELTVLRETPGARGSVLHVGQATVGCESRVVNVYDSFYRAVNKETVRLHGVQPIFRAKNHNDGC